MSAIDSLERRRFTAREILRMLEAGVLDEDEPLELIEGELVIVSPQGPLHTTALQIIAARLRSLELRDAHLRLQMPLMTSVSSMPEPDIALVRGQILDYRDRHPSGGDTLLAVEVALTSQQLDRAKAATYAKAGVELYWLVDLATRRIEVSTNPHPERAEFGVTRILAETESIEAPLTGATWKVTDLLP